MTTSMVSAGFRVIRSHRRHPATAPAVTPTGSLVTNHRDGWQLLSLPDTDGRWLLVWLARPELIARRCLGHGADQPPRRPQLMPLC